MKDKKQKTELVASAPTLERIQKLVADFFCGSTITLVPDGENRYKIHNLKGEISSVEVVKKGRRFRFHWTRG
jgi:hypothetical protein